MSSPDGSYGRRAVLIAAFGLAAIIGTAATPAFALGPRVAAVPDWEQTNLAYSADGIEYSAIFPVLFTSTTQLVPGEGLAESLWIRNDNTMTVKVWLAVPASGGIAQSHLHAELKPQSVVTIEPGASSELQAHVWLPESAGNDIQTRQLPVKLQIHVSEVADEGISEVGDNELGDTGAGPGIWPVGVAVLISGVGALLASRKRAAAPAGSAESAPAGGGS